MTTNITVIEFSAHWNCVALFVGMYSLSDIENLIEESLKMSKFHHPHVMKLIGVCIDMGESPYIVMPYMTNGSLQSYLKKHRAELTIDNNGSTELVRNNL